VSHTARRKNGGGGAVKVLGDAEARNFLGRGLGSESIP